MPPPNIPNGFIKLVELIENQRPRLPASKKVTDGDLWDNFCYNAFLGPDRMEAEIYYVYKLLYQKGMLERKILRKNGWITKAENILGNESKRIKGKAKEKKQAAIKKVLANIIKLHETLAIADQIFSKLSITPTLLKNEEKQGKIKEILADIVYFNSPNKIPDIGYTKAVLWLHSCGVGKDYAPDNNHTIKFLDKCGYGASARRDDYFVLMNYLKQVTAEINKNTKEKYTVAEISHAIFYFESTRSLLANKYKKYYDPALLLAFLKKKNWTIDVLADDWLFEIERVDELTNELESFISGTFKI